MPKFNADEIQYEPIELTLNGKTYTVAEVSQSMFDRIKETADKSKETGADMSVVYEQIGIILGVEKSEFVGCDIRRAGAALKYLTDSITAQIEGKSGNG